MIEIRHVLPPTIAASELEDYWALQENLHWVLEREECTGMQPFLVGYFQEEAQAQEEWRVLQHVFPQLTGMAVVKSLEDKDWKEAYKAYLKPWNDRCLHWVPLWERDQYIVPTGDKVVYLDAGMAFGTGSHETTRLCAQRMLTIYARQQSFANQIFLDVGCGSGILAISARKLGFGEVIGVDIDPEAVRVSRENAQQNAAVIDVRVGNLEGALPFADVVCANIQADILCKYAQTLCRSVRPGGTLILSGILAKECGTVYRYFRDVIKIFWEMDSQQDSHTMGEWCDLVFSKTK